MPLLLIFIIVVILIALTSARLNKERGRVGITGWIKDQDLDGKGKYYYFDRRAGIGCKPDVRRTEESLNIKAHLPATGHILRMSCKRQER